MNSKQATVRGAACAARAIPEFYHRMIDSFLQSANSEDAPLQGPLWNGWSIKKFVRTARPYGTVQIRTGRQILTAADPLPRELRDALTHIN